jgi:hypothetical protein
MSKESISPPFTISNTFYTDVFYPVQKYINPLNTKNNTTYI